MTEYAPINRLQRFFENLLKRGSSAASDKVVREAMVPAPAPEAAQLAPSIPTLIIELPENTTDAQLKEQLKTTAAAFKKSWAHYIHTDYGKKLKRGSEISGDTQRDAAQLGLMAEAAYPNSFSQEEIANMFVEMVNSLRQLEAAHFTVEVAEVNGQRIAVTAKVAEYKHHFTAEMRFPLVVKIGDRTIQHELHLVFHKSLKSASYLHSTAGVFATNTKLR